jgi:alpha-glucosidase
MPPGSPPWWRDAVFYEVYIRSFADGNGDGVGDFLGLRARLPHIAELGVDAIWITPFYPSPMADGGYDVTDHRAVDPTFGTLADFDAFMDDATAFGMRVLVDIVPNHTSSTHPWFRNAISNPRHPDRAKYIFRPPGLRGGPPNDWTSVFGGPAWALDQASGEYYLHLFAPEQPDLNWEHPEVADDFEQTLRFWLDHGVAGFRVDVSHGLFKDLGGGARGMWDQEAVHGVYRSWRKLVDGRPGDPVLVGEVWLDDPARVARYVRADEMHQAFNFHLLTSPWTAADFRRRIEKSTQELAGVGASSTWVLQNHDVVRHPSRYGGGAAGLRRALVATALIFALPGPAFLYQGEELGLEEVFDLPDGLRQDPTFVRTGGVVKGRDGCRVPLPWDGSPPGFGFTHGQPWLPIPPSWSGFSVSAQDEDEASTLAFYRRALRVRRALVPELAGTIEWLDVPRDCLAVRRRGAPGKALTCAANFGPREQELAVAGDVVLATDPGAARRGRGIALPPESAAWVMT